MAKRKSSYQAYLDNIEGWKKKGYHMDQPLSKKKFYESFNEMKESGIKNIAREMAKHERAYSMTKAREILKNIKDKKNELEEFDPKKHDRKEYGSKKAKVIALNNKYKTVKDIISVSNRKRTFMDLVEVYGFEEAREIY